MLFYLQNRLFKDLLFFFPLLLMSVSSHQAFAHQHTLALEAQKETHSRQSNSWQSNRPDAHAPISVMGDHRHQQNKWMFSYRYMTMQMEGNRTGNDRIGIDEVLRDYRVVPIKMTMDMHMFGAMYAPSDQVTVMLMLPYLEKKMDHITNMGSVFQTRTQGPGDVKASVLYGLFENDRHKIHLNMGVSFPSGATDERGETPMNGNAKLPYPMQLGSGSHDFLPGITYAAQYTQWSWGAQMSGVMRTERNDEDYRFGNEWQATSWTSLPLNSNWSVSLKTRYLRWQNIQGADPELNPMMIPTADPGLRGGKRADIGIGFNFLDVHNDQRQNRLAIEYTQPVYQNLEGPQLETDSIWTLGWQLAI